MVNEGGENKNDTNLVELKVHPVLWTNFDLQHTHLLSHKHIVLKNSCEWGGGKRKTTNHRAAGIGDCHLLDRGGSGLSGSGLGGCTLGGSGLGGLRCLDLLGGLWLGRWGLCLAALLKERVDIILEGFDREERLLPLLLDFLPLPLDSPQLFPDGAELVSEMLDILCISERRRCLHRENRFCAKKKKKRNNSFNKQFTPEKRKMGDCHKKF